MRSHLILVILALSLAACAQGVTPGNETDNEPITSSGCGVERWSVKTGADSSASQVNMTAQDTTIAALGALPVPSGLASGSSRFAGTAEMQLFRLSNVTLTEYKLENDSDYHLVINDGAGHTMIAEIPSPSCVSGGPWASAISAARAAFDAKFTASASFQSANVPVMITGVGFFDLPHGQTGVAPNALELHATLSICFPGSSVSGCSASTPDFSLGASPASVSGSGTSVISVTGSGGFSGNVALSAGGVPAGATASFSAASIASGGTSTLSLSPGTAAAGTYPITVSGTGGTITHTATMSWTIAGSGGGGGGGDAVVNGGFETGTFSGWTTSGQTAIVSSGAHSGAYAARVGGTSPSTDSSISQTVTLPAGAQLSFWVKVVCPDTVSYDWATVTVKSAAGTVLATPLAKTCSNSGSWVQKTADLSAHAGTTVTIVLANHDDNYAGDPTYTLFDDVSITGSGGGGGGGGTAVVNGDFETGSLSGWTSVGQTGVVNSGAHGGTYAAIVGSPNPSTDSSISQTVTLPTGSPQLTFWYEIVCPDSVQYDWASVQVTSASGAVLVTPLANTCSNSGTWVQGSADLTAWAGTTVTLSFNNHDDNYAGDATYTLFDDISISGGGGGGGTPDFALSLASASVSGATTDGVTVTPSGGFSGAVSLSVSGVPTGASASFNPASVSSGSSTLTLAPGTAANGTYALTVSGAGGGITHTAALSWTISSGGTGGGAIQTVFLIVMENHNWSSISGSSSAPYINNTILPQSSYALNDVNVPGLHPSLPNYLWLEAGTNFGVTADGLPSQYHQSTTQHLVTLLQSSGIPWKAYEEGISGTSCPLTSSGLYAPKHLPMVFFDDVTNSNNASSANCVSHVRPFTELAGDLTNNRAARYDFITPNLCDDMHNSTGCATSDAVKNGDNWLAANVPAILNSAAYRNNGLLLITWDESEGGDLPIGLIALSPKAKGHGYTNSIAYSHSSTLRTLQEIFGVQPMLGDAANATDLSDLFSTFP